MNPLLNKAQIGFATLKINQVYIDSALKFLESWLNGEEFKEYLPQIEYLILNERWDYLLDSFYQVIPFGTGGRRGEVGVGPNRINPWTIRASAQGHSQYLLKKHGDEVKARGVVFAYDVREFFGNQYLSADLPNPIKNLTSRDLAIAAAQVYVANGVKVYFFSDVRTTPELSFAIRHLKAVAGDMFSASHNPPDHNGKKVYDETGGQLIPPLDEELVTEVTQNVKDIKEIDYNEALRQGLIEEIDGEIDAAYIAAAESISLSKERGIKIVYTPLHGCGSTSVLKVLQNLGFEILPDPKTSNPSGKFENITFNIPNPEVVQSFDTTIKFAEENNAEIILSSDPDADRVGIMVRHGARWEFLSGNEIAAIITAYVIEKRKDSLKGRGVMIKTTVTTNLITKICAKNNIELNGELLIGFKYIGDIMNTLEKEGRIDNFLCGCEESHGYLAGNYSRDKDAVVPAIWLAELAAELKKENKTLVDYLNEVYLEYGYFQNYLTEVRLLGASGKEKISRMQAALRSNPPMAFGNYKVKKLEDCWNRTPLVSETDRVSKDMLIFHLEPVALSATVTPLSGVESMRVTIRPSGTEPKIKMYFEIGAYPAGSSEKLEEVKKGIENIMLDLEKATMLACYKIIDIDFPERGFLLFWQLPLDDKMKYFKIELEIERLKDIKDKEKRRENFLQLISFLGSNPVEKIDQAFKAKYKVSVLEYLNI
jgi:phosphoglucomutase/phosphomannomutase